MLASLARNIEARSVCQNPLHFPATQYAEDRPLERGAVQQYEPTDAGDHLNVTITSSIYMSPLLKTGHSVIR
jgi:hypothetical protein